MNFLKFVLFAGLLFLALPQAVASEKAGVTVHGTNEGGCEIPDVSLMYESKATGTEIYANVRVGGNRVCADTISADISLERDFGYISLDVGYDRHGVAVHDDASEISYYGSAMAETASLNLDVLLFEIGYDVINEAPRAEVDFELLGIKVNADVTKYPSTGVVSNIRASYAYELPEGWALTLSGTLTEGVGNTPDGINWADGAPPAPPDRVWAYGLGFTKEL